MIIRSINSFFNRFHRWVFGLLSLIIIIAFMGIMTPGQFSGCFSGSRNLYGRILGEDISIEELIEFRNKLQLIMLAYYGYNPQEITPEQAFQILAAQKAAESRGISVSQKEVFQIIQYMPAFMGENQKFDQEKYNTFIANIGRQGFTEKDFIDSASYQLISSKLMQEINQSVIITDNEVEDFYRAVNTSFDVKRFEIKTADLVSHAIPQTEALNTYFEGNNNNYIIDAKAKVVLAVFNNASPEFVNIANKAATADAIKKFYDENQALFTVKDKGVTPFAQAKIKAKQEFINAKTKDLAMRKAQSFANDVYSASQDEPSTCEANFNAKAKEFNAQILAPVAITSKSTKIGNIAIQKMVNDIFNSNLDVPVTNAVASDNGAYVAYVPTLIDARKAKLEEVKAKVIADYQKAQAAILTKTTLDNMYNKFSAMDKKELATSVNANKKFVDVKNINSELANSNMLAQLSLNAAATLSEGEISKPINTADGIMLVYVAKRIMPDMKKFEAEKAVWTSQYKQVKANAIMTEFNNYLSSKCEILAK